MRLGQRAGWSVLAMHAVFRPEAAKGLSESYEYRIGEDVFHARVIDGRLETSQGPAHEPDLVVVADPESFRAIASGQISATEALASGRIAIEGDPGALVRSAEIFGLPP